MRVRLISPENMYQIRIHVVFYLLQLRAKHKHGTTYDLMANIVHDGSPEKGSYKVRGQIFAELGSAPFFAPMRQPEMDGNRPSSWRGNIWDTFLEM